MMNICKKQIWNRFKYIKIPYLEMCREHTIKSLPDTLYDVLYHNFLLYTLKINTDVASIYFFHNE